MQEIFKLKDQPQYNLMYNSLFSRPLVKSVYKGTESLSFWGPKIWDILTDTYKNHAFSLENMPNMPSIEKSY